LLPDKAVNGRLLPALRNVTSFQSIGAA
jgi:hypothetical protein